jgi:hypothetical protein
MSIEKLSKVDEERIVKAIESAIRDSNSGTHPTDAIHKVASLNKFNPQLIKRACEAFNVSRTLAHMKQASGVDRAENFPLADPAAILERMYPEKPMWESEKSAAFELHSDALAAERTDFTKKSYARNDLPTEWSLKPSAYDRDKEWADGKSIDKAKGLEKLANYADGEYRAQFLKVASLAQEASEYFHTIGHSPFSEVEKRAVATFGSVGKTCMDMIYAVGKLKEKRAEEYPRRHMTFDEAKKPYGQIKRVIDEAYTLFEQSEKAANARAEAASAAARSPIKQAARRQNTKPSSLLGSLLASDEDAEESMAKSALDVEDLKGPIISGVGSSVTSALGLKPKGVETRMDAINDVFDPTHEAELQAAKTKTMLNDFVANDPILSAYEPHQVYGAYNHVAQFAPLASQHPALMRGVLHKVIQQEGVMEPFEAHQLSQIEKRLRDMQEDIPLMSPIAGASSKPKAKSD